MPHTQKLPAHLFAVVDSHLESNWRGDATNREWTVVELAVTRGAQGDGA